MRLVDVKVGAVYGCKVSGTLTRVRVESIQSGLGRVRIVCRNLRTGREIVCKSAQRLRSLPRTSPENS